MNNLHTITIISGAIISYFKLNYEYATIINLVLMKLFENDFLEHYSFYIFGFSILFIIYKKINLGWFKFGLKSYELRCNKKITLFSDYIDDHPEYFNSPSNIIVGDPFGQLNKLNYNMNEKRSEFNNRIYFNDKNNNFKGYYYFYQKFYTQNNLVTEKHTASNVQTEIPVRHLVICGRGNLAEYVESILEVQAKNRKLFSLSQTSNMKHKSKENQKLQSLREFYIGPVKSIEELEKIYIDTFFHVNIKNIYSGLKQIHLNPTEFILKTGTFPRANLLFHGPPGTGKSSLINRLCITFKRDCMRINILSFTCKKKMYDVFNNICNKDKILTLDEFDNDIFELLKRQDTLDCIDEGISNTKDPKQLKIFMDQRKSLIPEDKDFITIEDLFTSLQGPIQVESTIIIATMNRYEELINHPKYGSRLQALFRNGRMTPIYFGNLCQTTLNMITRYHFSRDMIVENLNDKKIPIVNVTNYLGELLMYDDHNAYKKLQSFILN